MSQTAKPPPFLLGATLLFWGWQSELLPVAAVMALILELARFTNLRWEITDEDFGRIWTLCAVMFLACALYAFTANEGPSDFRGLFQNPSPHTTREAGAASARTAASLIRWQPMIFFLFIAAQAYSSRQGVPLETISLIMGIRWKRAKRQGRPGPKRVHDVGFFYFALCLFSASIHPGETSAYFWGLCVLVAWALWGVRSPRFHPAAWGATLIAALAIGYGGQRSVSLLQRYVENLNPQWLLRATGSTVDPNRGRTSLGRIGRIKMSASIAVRLETHPGTPPPPYLREASYRSFRTHTWFSGAIRGPRDMDDEEFDPNQAFEGPSGGGPRLAAEDGERRRPRMRGSRPPVVTNIFENVMEETNRNAWVLDPGKATPAGVNLGCYLPGGAGLLPLPSGCGRLEKLSAYTVQKSPLGVVRVEGPKVVVFDALFGPGSTIDSPAQTPEDTHVPQSEQAALDQVIRELDLQGKSRQVVLRELLKFFNEKFTYATWQAEGWTRNQDSPTTRFLLKNRSGHCEYFATATVLLLRRLEIPARYAVGYAVHEKTRGNKYVVRQRDAHAWCLVWNEEKKLWQDFDTTPAVWVPTEMARASIFQSIKDWWQEMLFQISKLRWGQTNFRKYLLMGALPILVIFFIQVVFRRRKRHPSNAAKGQERTDWPGMDSEFYALEKPLSRSAVPRSPGETYQAWLQRCIATPELAVIREPLSAALHLHYRYRFDPAGITAADREALRTHTRVCLTALSKGLGIPNKILSKK